MSGFIYSSLLSYGSKEFSITGVLSSVGITSILSIGVGGVLSKEAIPRYKFTSGAESAIS